MKTQIVRNWMTPNPISVTPQTTLPEAHRMMVDYNIRFLPVVNKNKLVGIVTRRDINRAQSTADSPLSPYDLNGMLVRLTAREFMSHAVVTIASEATIGDAAKLMLEHQIGGLPVVEGGKLVGMITETDICLSVVQRNMLYKNN